MALSSTGKLLPVHESVYDTLISFPADPAIILPQIPRLLRRISFGNYDFLAFCRTVHGLNTEPLPRNVVGGLWVRLLMQEWEKWERLEKARLLWHVPYTMSSIGGYGVNNAKAKSQWNRAWEALKGGMRTMASAKTGAYFAKIRRRLNQRAAGAEVFFDTERPNVEPRLNPPIEDCMYTSTHRARKRLLNQQISAAEAAAESSFYTSVATLSTALAKDPSMIVPSDLIFSDLYDAEQHLASAPTPAKEQHGSKQQKRSERQKEANKLQLTEDETLELQMDNALESLQNMGLHDSPTPTIDDDHFMSPQKKRLEARAATKQKNTETHAQHLKAEKQKAKRAKRESGKITKWERKMASRERNDNYGGHRTDALMYDDEAPTSHNTARGLPGSAPVPVPDIDVDEVLARNVAEMKIMCSTEAVQQSASAGLPRGEAQTRKRERSESIEL